MAKIHVEINRQLQDVTKPQLFDLAKAGEIAPETRLVVDGKETKVRNVQGIEFCEKQPIPVPIPTKASTDEVVFEARPDWIRLTIVSFICMPLLFVFACICFVYAATANHRADVADYTVLGSGALLATVLIPIAAWFSCLGEVLTITPKKHVASWRTLACRN